MRFFTTKPFQLLVPSVQWTGPDNSIYLTFDDGPHPFVTSGVLDILLERNIRATFFLLGSNVIKHPEVAARIARDRHVIGNHGFDHSMMLFKGSEYVSGQIGSTRNVIQQHTGSTTRLFRPPYGIAGPAVLRIARSLGHQVVMWSIDSGDHEQPTTEVLMRRTMNALRPGSILLFHDNDRTAPVLPDFLPPFLDEVARRGFRFSALPS